ncbi:MAG: hypothetical protein M3342_03370 [Bacteroidota bacterium]|nr:hypothetical protein [Bacteroidota bacterium]
MSDEQEQLQAIKDIKNLMNKSSRFVSLSGWSGVAAGACALGAAVFTATKIDCLRHGDCRFDRLAYENNTPLKSTLFLIALVTFITAFTLSFLFTYLRSRKNGVPIWGYTARRVLINVAVPMVVGGLLIWRMMEFGFFGLVAPACLLFYGLAL